MAAEETATPRSKGEVTLECGTLLGVGGSLGWWVDVDTGIMTMMMIMIKDTILLRKKGRNSKQEVGVSD